MAIVVGVEAVHQHDGAVGQRRCPERDRVDRRHRSADCTQRSITHQHDHVRVDRGAQPERVGIGRHRGAHPAHRLQPAHSAPAGPPELHEQLGDQRRCQAEPLSRHRRGEGDRITPLGRCDLLRRFATGVGQHLGVQRLMPVDGEALGGFACRNLDRPAAQRLDRPGADPRLTHLGRGADAGDEQLRSGPGAG